MPLTNMCPWNSSLNGPCCGWAGKSLLMNCGAWQAALNFSLLPPPTYESGKGKSNKEIQTNCYICSCYLFMLFDPGVLPPGLGPSLLIYTIPWRNWVHMSQDRWATTIKNRTNIYNRESGGPSINLLAGNFLGEDFLTWWEKESKADFSSGLNLRDHWIGWSRELKLILFNVIIKRFTETCFQILKKLGDRNIPWETSLLRVCMAQRLLHPWRSDKTLC